MKSNVLKSLSAFAFALAIVASFAFSSMETVAVDARTQNPASINTPCVTVDNDDNCITTVLGPQCKVDSVDIFLLQSSIGSVQCTIPLYKPATE